MQCPKCQGRLELIRHSHIEVEGCTTCHGLLMTPEMIDQVLLFSMVESYIDVGNPDIGRRLDRIDEIQCPHCQVAMEKQEDPEQIHIWTEKCPSCDRTFFDAGELTDLKHKTVADYFLDLLKGHRRPD